jgi:hypothetical protein
MSAIEHYPDGMNAQREPSMSQWGHQRRFCRFVGMSVVRRIADENQISSDVGNIPIGDIGPGRQYPHGLNRERSSSAFN